MINLFEFICDVQRDTNFVIGDRFIMAVTDWPYNIDELPKIRFDYAVLCNYGDNEFQIGIPKNKTRNEFKTEMRLYYKDKLHIFDIGDTIDYNDEFNLITDLGSDVIECYEINADEIYRSNKKPDYFILSRKINGPEAIAIRERKPIHKGNISKLGNKFYIKSSALKRVGISDIVSYCSSAKLDYINKRIFYVNRIN